MVALVISIAYKLLDKKNSVLPSINIYWRTHISSSVYSSMAPKRGSKSKLVNLYNSYYVFDDYSRLAKYRTYQGKGFRSRNAFSSLP